jgi:hypothetical protein
MNKITRLLLCSFVVLLVSATCSFANAASEAVNDKETSPQKLVRDIEIIQNDKNGIEFILRPRILHQDIEADGSLSLEIDHIGSEGRPIRYLRIALPPNAQATFDVLSRKSHEIKGKLDWVNFSGENTAPQITAFEQLYGDINCLQFDIELLDENNSAIRLLKELHLKVNYGTAAGTYKRKSRLNNLELEANLLNPDLGSDWAEQPQPLRISSVDWDGDTWIKLGVETEGLFELVPENLSSLGLDPESYDPTTLKLYGYGGREIDIDPREARNNLFIPQEIPLIREIDANNAFDNQDKLLFYAQGLNGRYQDENVGIREFSNRYSRLVYYYLLAGGTEPGKTMTTLDNIGDPDSEIEITETLVDERARFNSSTTQGFYRYALRSLPADPYVFKVTDISDIMYTRQAAFVDSVTAPLLAETYLAIGGAQSITPHSLTIDFMPDLKTGIGDSKMIVIAPPEFMDISQQLVDYKNSSTETSSRLVNIDEIYREFSCGVADPGAIRNYLRYEFLNALEPAKFVLLVGNGHGDYLGEISGAWPIRIPAWYDNSRKMVDDLYVRLLNDRDVNMISGRLPANSVNDVSNYLEKLINYENRTEQGFWQNQLAFVADDEHGEDDIVSYFEMTHSEDIDSLIDNTIPKVFDVKRIYSFEYPRVYNPEIRVFEKPLCEQKIIETLNSGTVLITFMGHGNNTTWTHENVFNSSKHLQLLSRNNKPAMYSAATCSWAEIDLTFGQAFPQQLINMEDGGAIGILAATRKTTGSGNFSFLKDMYPILFARFNGDNDPVTMAEAMKMAKNMGSSSSRRLYIYLGDPSVMPAFPDRTGELIGVSVDGLASADTLLSHSSVSLDVQTWQTEPATNDVLSGQMEIVIREAPIARRYHFEARTNSETYHGRFVDYEHPGPLLFAGSASLDEGLASLCLNIPADVSGLDDPGQIRGYFSGPVTGGSNGDGLLYDDNIYFRINPDPPIDTIIPELSISFNSPHWREDDWLPQNSRIIVRISDENGINTTGSIGHRIEMEIDNGYPLDMTSRFIYDADVCNTGELSYPLPLLDQGSHNVKVRAFDSYNNPGTVEANFLVQADDGQEISMRINELVNFPNPVDTSTQFTFKLVGAVPDNPPQELELLVYTLRGRRVSSSKLDLESDGIFMWSEEWHPRNDNGDKLARGVYLYQLKLEIEEQFISVVDSENEDRQIPFHLLPASISETGRMIVH